MRFSNKDILKVARQALEQSILPAVSEREAQAACATVLMGIDELMKREIKTRDILMRLLPEGIAIAERMLSLLKDVDGHKFACQKRQLREISEALDGGSLSSLEIGYNTLLGHIETTARALSDHNRDKPCVAAGPVLKDAANWECRFYDEQRPPLAAAAYDRELQAGELNAESLRAFLSRQPGLGEQIQVARLERIPGGMSKETYFFELSQGADVESLVVRKSDPKPALTKRNFRSQAGVCSG